MPAVSKPLRHSLVAAFAEAVGTFLFLFFAFAGTQIVTGSPPTGADAGKPNASNLIYISLSFGLSLLANVLIFYRISGGIFNPAVSVALCAVGAIPVIRAVAVSVGQFLGGIAAAGVASALFPTPLNVDTSLAPAVSVVQGLFIEVFLTAELVLAILLLAVEKHRATYLAPFGIGLAFFLTQLAGVFFTGGSLNPARSLGPAIVNQKFPSYFWIYFVGPLLGSLLASGFYFLLGILRWKEINPEQDSAGGEELEARPSHGSHDPLVTQA